MNILLTGASGFVGSYVKKLCPIEIAKIFEVKHQNILALDSKYLSDNKIELIIHLSALVHETAKSSSWENYLYSNVTLTKHLIKIAESENSPVKKFIYLSSIKVLGELSPHGFSDDLKANPANDYAKSKLLAEEAIQNSKLNYLILRPPLVYGLGAKANFGNLIKLCSYPFLPLPFKNLNNRRSLIYVENLVKILFHLAQNESVKNETFLISNREVVSTQNLISELRLALHVKNFLLPHTLLKIVLGLMGKAHLYDKLAGNLYINPSPKLTKLLENLPLISFPDSIKYTVIDRLARENIFLRCLEILFALILAVVTLIPGLLIAIIIKLTSKGPAIHWSKRVGRDNQLFLMPKFRTMLINTPQLATHLLQNPANFVTPVGKFLRLTSLDELPQLITILTGKMSFIGPRPALFNQDDLVKLRTEKGIHKLKPGVTGWAQVNGRDELSIEEKVKFEEEYLFIKTVKVNLKILWLTLLQVIKKSGISH